jgi:hypothetical protein
MQIILPLLHATCPYEGFTPLPEDRHGWNADSPLFRGLIERLRPKLIVEVGTWKGASALHMAGLCGELGLETEIVCVDTWLGSAEMWHDHNNPLRYRSLRLRHGYPQVYFQFISNVIHAGQQSRITPFPQTSANAAEWFATKGLRADMIYLDGSHCYAGVKADIAAWWPLVRSGGVLFGDDFDDNWPDVQMAVTEWGVPVETGDRKWWTPNQ